MGRRIIYGYIGALLLPVVILPLVFINPMDAHSLIFAIIVFGAPIGMLIGLGYIDYKSNISVKYIIIRSIVGLFLYILLRIIGKIIITAITSSDTVILRDTVMILLLLANPCIVAVITSYVCLRSINAKV